MPLRCIDDNGNDVEADKLDETEWRNIEAENRLRRYLRMPCCNSEVVLKAPANRTRHFAHKARNNCDAKPETEVHLYLKKLARDIARECGWNARTEVSGTSPDGESWRADVFVEKDKRKGVVEIQWSGQSVKETLRRQKRYQDSGIGCIWILRQPGWPLTRNIPAACLAGNLEKGLTILIPKKEYITAHMRNNWEENIGGGGVWSRDLTPNAFFKAIFEDRFRFGIKPGSKVPMTVWSRKQRFCWRCYESIDTATHLKGSVGPFKLNLSGDYINEILPEMNCPYGKCSIGRRYLFRNYRATYEEREIGKVVDWEINEFDIRRLGFLFNRWEVWTPEEIKKLSQT